MLRALNRPRRARTVVTLDDADNDGIVHQPAGDPEYDAFGDTGTIFREFAWERLIF
jgi:hypothetical protein